MIKQTPTAVASPVEPPARLLGLDVARGIALLGIFVVNIQFFSQAFGHFAFPVPESGDWLTRALFYVQGVFFTGRFYPLFSMLFGMGLVLMLTSSRRRGAENSFTRTYFRRLGALFVIGLAHGLGLWYGDVLLTYSLCGVVMLLCRNWPPKALIPVGVGLVLVGTVLYSGLASLNALSIAAQRSMAVERASAPDAAEPPASTDESSASDDSSSSQAKVPPEPDGLDRLAQNHPFLAMIDGYRDERIVGGPEDPEYMRLETLAYREGPWIDAQLFRVMTWAMFVVVTVLSVFWHVLGLFFIGAGVMKVGIVDERQRPLRLWLIGIGLLAGVPLSVVSVWCAASPANPLLAAAAVLTGFIGGPLMAVGYLCLALRLAEARGRVVAALAHTLGAAGRMALSNYLLQTVVSTLVFYHWGLGQFGLWTRPEKWAMVLGVFAAQCVVSVIWLRVFRMGPMEWAWRSVTYWAIQPLRRESGGPTVSTSPS